MGFYDLVPLLSHGYVAPLSHLLPSLQPSKFGVLSQVCRFLECSFFPVLPGDVLLNLQTQLQFPFLEEASPDLFRQSKLLPSLDVLMALFIWVKIPKDWTLREWHYWKPEPVGFPWWLIPCNSGDLGLILGLGWEDPLEKGMATHSSILAWRIPWTEETGGLQSRRL